ncbi:TetR/AcrR family transcriptional regulator [Mycobacterium sp. UM_CSW]|uniref:TetR/AcrR family transcriptional regulator n=1 Tax=Mycobacterium sp. UM_CSW TaxID=1370119 RepID=UPI001268A5E7|nr:TetR/AcrR family transcriptional regulator [Mycobacterium sp. UM_CSW]
MTEPRVSLRERKKLDARRQVLQVANKMFRKYGYDAVTLEQIADACVMSVRTILRYFNTKEALALAGEHELLESFRAQLGVRETDAVTCWRNFRNETLPLMETPESRERMRAIYETPPLLAEFLRIGEGYQQCLTAAIAEDWGEVASLEATVFASVLVSTTSAAFRRWYVSEEPFDLVALQDIVDRVCVAFDKGRQSADGRRVGRVSAANTAPTRRAPTGRR